MDDEWSFLYIRFFLFSFQVSSKDCGTWYWLDLADCYIFLFPFVLRHLFFGRWVWKGGP